MSTTSLQDAPALDAPADPSTFRGRTLEELLPQIREQLGPDAVVVRQREGLMGGIGGFFQQRFVEVVARAGAPRIDVYDEEPATPESVAALLAEAEDADAVVTAALAPQPATADADRAGGAGEDDSASLLAERLTPRQDPPAAHPSGVRSGTAISRLRILPVGPFGSSGTSHTWRGYL
jgi:flagellar biosynthesis GTPase FlhF